MRNKLPMFIAISLMAAVFIPSIVSAGNVKKTYINIAKEGNKATAADLGNITTNYAKISMAASQMTYLKAQGSQFGKVVPIYKTATINGGAFQTEKTQGSKGLGNAFNNNGIAIWAPTTAELDAIKDEYTVEMWLKLDNYSKYYRYQIFNRTHNISGNGYPFYVNMQGDNWGTSPSSAGTLDIHGSTLNSDGTYTNKHLTGSPRMEKNKWYHIAFSYHKDKGIQFYMNGVPVGSRNGIRGEVVPAKGGVGGVPINGANLNAAVLICPNLHNNNVNTSDPTKVAPNPNIHIDEIRVWNVDRNAQEIKENYNKPLTGKEKGLAFYMNFDE